MDFKEKLSDRFIPLNKGIDLMDKFILKNNDNKDIESNDMSNTNNTDEESFDEKNNNNKFSYNKMLKYNFLKGCGSLNSINYLSNNNNKYKSKYQN